MLRQSVFGRLACNLGNLLRTLATSELSLKRLKEKLIELGPQPSPALV